MVSWFFRLRAALGRRLEDHDREQAAKQGAPTCRSCGRALLTGLEIESPFELCARCVEIDGSEAIPPAAARLPKIGDTPRAFPLGRVH